MNLVLGAGLSGLSASYHIGHDRCLLLEAGANAFGHIRSTFQDGFTWDEGPHVSFTKHDYVRHHFADGVEGEFDEYEVSVGNYFRGHWIDHPAQSSLYQVPEPLRSACLESFLATRNQAEAGSTPRDYAEWLARAFGPVFARTFPEAYTRKYWTREAREMSYEWIGDRVFLPKIEDIVAGSVGPLDRSTHYITRVRYPRRGGFQHFARKLAAGASIRFNAEAVRIDLKEQRVWTSTGECHSYERLINTMPLPVFVRLCVQCTPEAAEAAEALSCTQLLLVNATAPHPTRRPENWIYVYDDDKLATRINCTEMLTPGNAPSGWTGVQTEVYSSRHRPLKLTEADAGSKVVEELREIGLIDPNCDQVDHFTRWVPWANVIFDHGTRPALETIWHWLERYGVAREEQDTHPLTDWSRPCSRPLGSVVMAGRFGQWKYFWTDDCVLRGRELGRPS